MFKIEQYSNTMTVIKKDTVSFTVSLDNYILSDGDKVTFTVAEKLEQEKPIIQKVATSFVDGVATITLDSIDTDIEIGTYLYDIQIDLASGVVDTIIGPAHFIVEGGVTY